MVANRTQSGHVGLLVLASVGYFVDVYDIAIYGIVRVASLHALGLSEAEILSTGVTIFNLQLVGMILGGVAWGFIGDRFGRRVALFGSIILFSTATIANALVQTVPQYGVLRFIAGFGLAGELGGAVTLVSEQLSRQSRGYGTTLLASVGLCGGIAASLSGAFLDWRMSYLIGGLGGFLLLPLRALVPESPVYSVLSATQRTSWRSFAGFLLNRHSMARCVRCFLIGTPTWFVYGVVIALGPEIAASIHDGLTVTVARTSVQFAIGLVIGDVASGLLSQWFKTRKSVILAFISFGLLGVLALLSGLVQSAGAFYVMCTVLGFFMGYWAVFLTTIAEQFGTDFRTTATASIPNFVRGSAIPMTLLFLALKNNFEVTHTLLIIGLCSFIPALVAAMFMRETFGDDLSFVEGQQTTKHKFRNVAQVSDPCVRGL